MAIILLNKVGESPSQYIGLSADIKPTDVSHGSTFYEEDTGTPYVYGGSGWVMDYRHGESVAHKSTDATMGGAAPSDTLFPSQKAVKDYVDALAGVINAVVYKGVIDCSGNPNYPAADAGHLYMVSVAGKIGGVSGLTVEAGDLILCKTDGTVAGTQAAVGANWGVVQSNLVPADYEVVVNKDIDGTLAANSDTKYPSQKAVKTYVDTGLLGVYKTLVGDIGMPGAPGYGVGICPTVNLPPGMTPLSNYDDPVSSNYGNYQYVDGSVMCFIPKFYYKIGTGVNGLAVNLVRTKPASAYANTAAANADGHALHRAFIDGGVEQVGFFIDKYMVSKVAKGAGYVGASIKNGLPLSTAAAHNPIADLTASGGVNAYYKTIDCAHARDGVNGAVNAASIFHVTSIFQKAALALLSMAHGQASSSTAWCAWYNATYNYPKGCNNNALRDQDDATILYVTDGYSNCGKTGSGAQFAKTTHNGQECGVADLNGLMYEISLGITCIASTVAIAGMSQAAACVITLVGHGLATNDFVQIDAITQADWVGANGKIWQITKINDDSFSIPFNSSAFGTAYDPVADPGTITKGTFYVAKQATSMKSFTSGNAAATDHWGATGVAAMMDAFVPPFKPSGAYAQRMGSGANQVLSEVVSGAGWLLAGMGMPKDSGGIDPTGIDLFGKDYFYQYIRNELCLLSCAAWGGTSAAGVWCLYWSNYRAASGDAVGWRCACSPV